jgi:nucleoside-diphosphate-sugar epimerase
MKVLITGGAGYKGCVLSERLLDEGHEVTILDIFLWGVRPILHILDHPKLTVVKGDVQDEELYGTLIESVDAVVNLAGIVGFPACRRQPRLAQKVNCDSVKFLASRLNPNQQLIQASTGSVYGKLDDICRENSPTNPLTVYGVTKLEAEKYVLGAGGVCLRFATAFGLTTCPRFDLLPNFFVWKAITDGYIVAYETEAMRTLIDVRDMASAYSLTLANYPDLSGGIFNTGHESLNVTKRQVLEAVKEIIPEYEIIDMSIGTDPDQRDYEVDYSMFREVTGFEPKYSLMQSLLGVKIAAGLLSSATYNEWRV